MGSSLSSVDPSSRLSPTIMPSHASRRRTALRVAHGPLQIVYLAGVILTAALEFLELRGVSRSYGRGV